MQIDGAEKYLDRVLFKPITFSECNNKFDLKNILFVFVKSEYCYSVFHYTTG